MKKIKYLLLLIALVLVVPSCSGKVKDENSAEYPKITLTDISSHIVTDIFEDYSSVNILGFIGDNILLSASAPPMGSVIPRDKFLLYRPDTNGIEELCYIPDSYISSGDSLIMKDRYFYASANTDGGFRTIYKLDIAEKT